ncbi:Fanconi anemia core complex-associated protein 24-like isoform X2 [Patiria miniata]|uniref:Fanconi anemia core complex-associated protein 24 pseudonuclease domain-containing protein n=1 Tax=Patiria miniata TaxID=46514 RepID=A0A914B3D5_PATMI|nr:Fanconi anemia core complex-associated protein 24-like isoform X2 [Patiria miniata]
MSSSRRASVDQLSQIPCTPVNEGGRVPPGCIVTSQRWKGSELVNTLQGKLKVIMEDKLGVIDFHPSNEAGVVYISETDLVAGSGYKQKLAKLRKANSLRGVVVAERTPISEQYYADLQKFVSLELGLKMLFVVSQTEAANLLIQMVNEEHKPHANPFLVKRRKQSIDAGVLATVHLIPNVGPVKAKVLLQRFRSIKGIGVD